MRTEWMTIAVVAACSRGPVDGGTPAPQAAPIEPVADASKTAPPTTPNAFFARGVPSFVVGTAGDAASDRSTAGQVRFIAAIAFPGAPILEDTSIDPQAGHAAWPPRPVLYGGPHVHALLAATAGSLPFEMTADRLVIGGRTYVGEGIRLITVVPETTAHPEFLLYAGTGNDGVAEINAGITKGNEGIAIADAFGPLAQGRWVTTPDGATKAELGPDLRRIEWRTVARPISGSAGGGKAEVEFRFPAELPASADEDAVIAAGLRGIERAIARLEIASPAGLTFYVYPDAGSKRSLTGNGGDGHAVPAARALHVRAADTSEGGGMESLVAHEATHVLVRGTWGSPGSVLFGEGIAVWANGAYQGRSLAAWKPDVSHQPIIGLLDKRFMALPEQQSYPLAGLVLEAVIAEVGLAKVREHLYGATASDWQRACEEAGTTPEALDAAVGRLLAAKD